MLGLALVIALGFVAYRVISSASHPASALPAAGPSPVTHRHAGHATPPAGQMTTHAAHPHAHQVVIHLSAIQDCWVEFTTPGGRYLFQSYVVGGTSKWWTFRHAIDMRLGNPGGITLTVDGKNPLLPGLDHPITLTLGLNGKVSS